MCRSALVGALTGVTVTRDALSTNTLPARWVSPSQRSVGSGKWVDHLDSVEIWLQTSS